MEHKNELDKIVSFINSIGIDCRPGVVAATSFLPGVDIVNGSILFDEMMMLSSGDLLHEAGHIAVLTSKHRESVSSPDVSGDLDSGGSEMAAIAWSWAALTHLKINPDVVFHENGYHGGSASIIENFSTQRYFGVSVLQWLGMTKEKKVDQELQTDAVYPGMKSWLRP